MKLILKNNWYLISALLPLIISTLFTQLFLPAWDDNIRNILFYSVFLYYICLILTWIVINNSFLFQKKEHLLNIITIIGSAVTLLWTYKHKITFRLDILLLFLCALYGIIYRRFSKPTYITSLFFVFILFRILALFWSEHFQYGVDILFNEEKILFFLLLPIVYLGFSTNEKQQISFISICFKGFLLLLIANIIFYSFAINIHPDKHFFNFITLNKSYFYYYEILFWTRFKHPSFLSSFLLVFWGLGIFIWKKNKAIISTPEIIAYSVFLFSFILMVQARVAIISYFIVLSFFIYKYIEPKISKTLKYSLIFSSIVIGSILAWYLTTKTSYFSDPVRNKIYEKAFEAIKQANIFIGNGSGYQRYIMKDFVYYVHNDFVAILVDIGLIGLTIFVFWIIAIFLSKDILKQYLIIALFAIMNTDVVFHVVESTYILIPLMIFILFAPKNKYLQ